MLDKSIDGALLALRKQIIKQGAEGLAHVEALLELRGVSMPKVTVLCAPVAKRGCMRRMALQSLKDGPMTRRQIVDHIAPLRPDVPPERLYWRVDAALQKLRKAGVAARDGRLWGLAQ